MSSGRRLLRLLLLIAVPTLAVLAGVWLWLAGGRFVVTENAYVKTDIVQIAPEVDGPVVTVPVRDQQPVQSGALLFQIDPEPYRIALALAEAELAAVRNEVEAKRAEYREAAAELSEAEARVRYMERQAGRMRELESRGAASAVRRDEAMLELAVARDRIAVARQKMQRVQAALGGDVDIPAARHPEVVQAAAKRDRAALDLARTTVRAPEDGIVTNMRLQPGEYVKAGTPTFSIVSARIPWIEANLKETELTHLRVGQSATIEVDAYPGLAWRAEVESISAATGAEFAILPPQNATGNWVKIVQRLPVRLRLLETRDDAPLRAGMTVTARIDTERERELSSVIRSAFARFSGE